MHTPIKKISPRSFDSVKKIKIRLWTSLLYNLHVSCSMKVLTYFDHSASSFVSSFFSALVLSVVLKRLNTWWGVGVGRVPCRYSAWLPLARSYTEILKKKEKEKEKNASLHSGCLSLKCFSGCLMSSAGDQNMFCAVCSAFKWSFDEFVGEKVVSPSYSSATLAPPLLLEMNLSLPLTCMCRICLEKSFAHQL